jgi:iron complex outermembrane receptor protein
MLDLNLKLGDYTLTSTTAYQHENQRQVQDIFQTAVYFFDTLVSGSPVTSNPVIYNDSQVQREQIKQWSEELKVVSPADRIVSFVSGVFFSDTTVDETYFRPLPVAEENLRVTPNTATYDVYGRLTWRVTPAFSVLAGLRYNYDVIKYKYDETIYGLSPTLTFGPYYSTSNSNYCSTGAATAPSTVSGYDYSGCHSQAVVGDLSLRYNITSDLMAYATYARGYSPEVYNTAATLTSNAPLQPTGQEHINHFELGAKGSFFDRHVIASVALFDTIYNDFQIQQFSVISGAINPLLNLQAAGKAETRGVEFNTEWRASEYTTVTLNAAYVDAVFKNYPGAACEPDAEPGVTPANCTTNADGSVTQDMSGKPMPNSPKWKLYVDGQQRVPLGSLPFDLTLDANWAYRTAAQMLPNNNPNGVMPAIGILNLSGGLTAGNDKWSVVAFCNNVFNKVYYQDVEDFWSSPWSGTSTVIAQPARDARRYGGVRATYSF